MSNLIWGSEWAGKNRRVFSRLYCLSLRCGIILALAA